MTKDRYTLGKGRLYFEDSFPMPGDDFSLMQRRSGTFTMKIDMPRWREAQLARDFFGRDPIPHLVGYNPQKLLPAPGSDPSWFRRDFLANMAALLGTPYMTENLFRPSDFRPNEVIDFETISPTARSLPFQRYPETTWRHKRAVLVVGADYGDLEARILAAYALPGVVALQLDMQEPAGEIYGPYGIYERPTPRVDKPKKQNGRSASYLDHDPTKKHKRGRKR